MDARFPRSLRLLRRRDFRRVFDGGRSRSDGDLIVYARPREEGGPARLGLVVGRKFGPAVLRNAVKRRYREAFRIAGPRLPEGHDLVVLPARPGRVPSQPEAEESLIRTAARAAKAYAEQGPRAAKRKGRR